MGKKSIYNLLKKSIACLVILAVFCGMLLPSGVQAADVDPDTETGITLEITVKTDDGEEIKTISSDSLREALVQNGIKRGDVICMKITGGTVKTTDWSEICYNRNIEDDADASYMNLTSILAGEGVRGEDISDRTASQSFPKSLKTVVLPEGVTKIGGEAFLECENLQKVILPQSMRTISLRAFRNCGNLQEINFPNGMTIISSYAFYGCKSLQKVDLPDTMTTIGEHTFENCSSIQKIIIPKAVSKLGMSAFEACTSLEEVEIRGSAKLEASTFVKCSSLKEVTLPNGLILDYEDPPSYRNPSFCPMFASCQLSILNIVLKEGETAENMTPVTCTQVNDFDAAFSKKETPAIFFSLPDGTLLSEDTTPTLDEVAARYLSEDDGNTGDNLWYGWEIGQSYEVENRLTNLSTSNESTVWKSPEGSYTAVLSGEDNSGQIYELPKTIQVTIGEKEAVLEEDYTYDPATGELVIFKDSISGKIVVTAQGNLTYYDVTVSTQGGGTTKIQTSLVSVSSDGNSKVRVYGGDDMLLTFLPAEGCSLKSLTIDGEAVEVPENTYNIPHIKSAHTILVTFTEKTQPTPEPTPTPVVTPTPEPPIPTETSTPDRKSVV